MAIEEEAQKLDKMRKTAKTLREDFQKGVPPSEGGLSDSYPQNSPQGGETSDNMFMLGAVMFAAVGGCTCKACLLLRVNARKSVEGMVDNLLEKTEVETP